MSLSDVFNPMRRLGALLFFVCLLLGCSGEDAESDGPVSTLDLSTLDEEFEQYFGNANQVFASCMDAAGFPQYSEALTAGQGGSAIETYLNRPAVHFAEIGPSDDVEARSSGILGSIEQAIFSEVTDVVSSDILFNASWEDCWGQRTTAAPQLKEVSALRLLLGDKLAREQRSRLHESLDPLLSAVWGCALSASGYSQSGSSFVESATGNSHYPFYDLMSESLANLGIEIGEYQRAPLASELADDRVQAIPRVPNVYAPSDSEIDLGVSFVKCAEQENLQGQFVELERQALDEALEQLQADAINYRSELISALGK